MQKPSTLNVIGRFAGRLALHPTSLYTFTVLGALEHILSLLTIKLLHHTFPHYPLYT